MNLEEIAAGKIQQVEIPESIINKLLNSFGQNCTVRVCNDFVMFSTENFQAEFTYHSHDFNNTSSVINFNLHRIKPFYYSMGLQLIHKRYPYLEYWKDQDGNKMITCHMDRISGIDSILKDYKPYADHIDVESAGCREGKIIVGLRTKSGGTEGDEQHV